MLTGSRLIHLTDCASGQGTWRLVQAPPARGGQQAEGDDDGASGASPRWESVRQAFVAIEQRLRLGEHECTAAELLRLVEADDRTDGDGGGDGGGRGRWHVGAGMRGGGDRVRASVERDPVTGEIIRRRL